jgi:hypothetical protein
MQIPSFIKGPAQGTTLNKYKNNQDSLVDNIREGLQGCLEFPDRRPTNKITQGLFKSKQHITFIENEKRFDNRDLLKRGFFLVKPPRKNSDTQ